MYSPKRRPTPTAVSKPMPMPMPVPVPMPMRSSCQRPSSQEPGSPVTPPLTDPATSSGLHLLCLAANASPSPPPHMQLAASIRPAPSPSHTPPPPPRQSPPHPPPPAVAVPSTPTPMHGVAAPSATTPTAGGPSPTPTPTPASFTYAPQGIPAPFLHPGFMAPQYVTLPSPMGYYAPYYPSAPVAVRVLPDMGVSGAHAHAHASAAAGVRKVKGPWRKEEDELLTALVGRFGARRWTTIAAHIPGRTGKQARERWLNQLSPDLAKRGWSAAEDRIVMDAHARLGNRWSEIAKLLKGRTDNAVKNRFNTTIRRQISELAVAGAGAGAGAGAKRAPPTSDCESDDEPPRSKARQ